MSLTIYGIARTRTSRVLWLAEELGLAYRHEKLAPAAGDTRRPEFLRLNPMGRVPAIDDGGLVLWESLAINLHLARRYGRESGLGPRDHAEDALIGQWTLFAATELEPDTHEVLVHTVNLPEDQREPERRDAALARLARPLSALEAALAQGGGCLVGGRFTVADLNVATMIFYLRAAPQALDPYPTLAAWYRAATGRPAFRRMIALREAG